jgi:hypothetical protein
MEIPSEEERFHSLLRLWIQELNRNEPLRVVDATMLAVLAHTARPSRENPSLLLHLLKLAKLTLEEIELTQARIATIPDGYTLEDMLQMAAYLRYTLGQTYLTASDLHGIGFPVPVVQAVCCLTRSDGLDIIEASEEIQHHSLASAVMTAELRLTMERLSEDEKEARNKCRCVIDILRGIAIE